MIQSLPKFVRKTSIISSVCSSLIIGLITISQAGGPPPGTTKPPTQAPSTQQSETTPSLPRFPEPASRVRPSNGRSTLRLINHTNAVVEYQVIGGPHRTLGETAVVELYELPIPLTITYQRSDGGLLLVNPRNISPRVLEVRFNTTEDFDLDTKSLNINSRGRILLN